MVPQIDIWEFPQIENTDVRVNVDTISHPVGHSPICRNSLLETFVQHRHWLPPKEEPPRYQKFLKSKTLWYFSSIFSLCASFACEREINIASSMEPALILAEEPECVATKCKPSLCLQPKHMLLKCIWVECMKDPFYLCHLDNTQMYPMFMLSKLVSQFLFPLQTTSCLLNSWCWACIWIVQGGPCPCVPKWGWKRCQSCRTEYWPCAGLILPFSKRCSSEYSLGNAGVEVKIAILLQKMGFPLWPLCTCLDVLSLVLISVNEYVWRQSLWHADFAFWMFPRFCLFCEDVLNSFENEIQNVSSCLCEKVVADWWVKRVLEIVNCFRSGEAKFLFFRNQIKWSEWTTQLFKSPRGPWTNPYFGFTLTTGKCPNQPENYHIWPNRGQKDCQIVSWVKHMSFHRCGKEWYFCDKKTKEIRGSKKQRGTGRPNYSELCPRWWRHQSCRPGGPHQSQPSFVPQQSPLGAPQLCLGWSHTASCHERPLSHCETPSSLLVLLFTEIETIVWDVSGVFFQSESPLTQQVTYLPAPGSIVPQPWDQRATWNQVMNVFGWKWTGCLQRVC